MYLKFYLAVRLNTHAYLYLDLGGYVNDDMVPSKGIAQVLLPCRWKRSKRCKQQKRAYPKILAHKDTSI
jgi:hypothetical protein